MPLREGSSDKVIQDNIKSLLDGDAGYDPPYKDPARKEYTPAQAAAIAYAKAGKRKNSAETLKGQKQSASKQSTSDNAEDSDPCWDDYEMVGMKKGKGGKSVPNCVKKSDNAEQMSYSEIVLPDGWTISPRFGEKPSPRNKKQHLAGQHDKSKLLDSEINPQSTEEST